MSLSKEAYSVTIDIDAAILTKLQINTKPYTVSDTKYTILNADKTYLCNDDKIRRTYNSVIIDDNKDILSIGMPIQTPIEQFKKYSNVSLQVTELIEGSVIYLFYDPRKERWEIATSNAIGGAYSYFRTENETPMTFLNMVMDAFREDNTKSLNDLVFLEYFDKKYCYGFVLQHPENQMVQSIETPKMYIISVCELHCNSKNNIRYVRKSEYESWDFIKNLEGIIYFPKTIDNIIDYENIYMNMQIPKENMGICVTNENGDRCEIINSNYKEAKDIRGNNFNLQFHYLCLLKLDKVSQFLNHFPSYKDSFLTYRKQLSKFITNLHQTYFKYYVSKHIKGPIHKKYYYHINQIHKNIFVPSIEKGEKKIIKRAIVSDYVMSLEPGQILHMINFEKHSSALETEY